MVSGPPSDHPLNLNFGDLHTFTSRRMSSPSPDHGELHEKPPKEPTEDSFCATPNDDQTHGEELANTENAAETSAVRLHHRGMGRWELQVIPPSQQNLLTWLFYSQAAAARFRENKRQYIEVLLEREAVSKKQRSDLREEILCMRETLMEYQTLLMRHKDCPQYRAMGGYCGHQILASIERFKGSVFRKFALPCLAWRTDDG